MRAVAIALVVGYHIGAPGMSGGFIGVDVFFVISGYLITRQLWAENERTRTIDVTGFWARRIRRLAPAATLMILAVVVAASVVGSPLAWDEVSRAAVAASLSISNGYFGVQSADYFAAEVSSNPLLHTWSLAVEEQFYLVWPVLLLAVAGLGGASVDHRRRRWVGAIAVVTVVSFGLGLALTARGTPWAFYASPARAWEFGLGAMAALVYPARLLASDRRRTLMAGAGLALLVLSLVLIDGSTAFPGTWALLPAAGTTLLVLAEAPALVPVLSLRPLQWIGRLSYGWYLWHWPVLVLGIAYLGPVGLPTRTLLAVAALVPAVWSYRLVERPVRHSRPLARSPRANFVMGGALVAVVIVGVAVGGARIRDRLAEPGVQVLAAAQEDVPPLADASCESLDVDDLLASCLAVPPDGDRSDPILLVGDSHAGHWQPAVEEGAVALGRPLVTSWRGNCPAIPVAVTVEGRSSADCRSRQDGLLDLVDDLEPAAVVLSHSAAYDV
ncbi:MAG: acyltransferase family protein, partial [Acidimicrobiales bacterium]